MKMHVAVGILAVVAAVVVGSQGAVNKRLWPWEEAPQPTFEFKSCGAGQIDITSVEVSPDPIVLPGTINVAVSGEVKSTLEAPIKVELKVESKVGGVWIEVPCVANVGSCTYDDVCQLLDQQFGSTGCPALMVENNIPCTCPIAAGTYTFPSTDINIAVPFFPGGEYHVIARLSHNGQSVGCFEVNAKIA